MAGLLKAIGAACNLTIRGCEELCDGLVDGIRGTRRLGKESGGNLINAANKATKAVDLGAGEMLNEQIVSYARSLPKDDILVNAVGSVKESQKFLAALENKPLAA